MEFHSGMMDLGSVSPGGMAGQKLFQKIPANRSISSAAAISAQGADTSGIAAERGPLPPGWVDCRTDSFAEPYLCTQFQPSEIAAFTVCIIGRMAGSYSGEFKDPAG